MSQTWVPHEYQKKAVRWLVERGAAALFLDPGLGKTAITLAAIKILLRQGMINRVLVIAPLRVCYEVWPKEVEKWADFHGLSVAVLHGPGRVRAERSKAVIHVVNPESLDKALANGVKYDLLVVDELTRFKRPSTQRFKLLKTRLGSFSRRWGLTGSPAANGLLDLFGQMYVLDMGRSLGPYITAFRAKYLTPTGYMGYAWKLREGADAEIFERVAPVALRMSAEDYLTLPPLLENWIEVDLPEWAAETYRQMEDELLAEIEDGEVTAANAAVASGKCRQIAGGAIYLRPGRPEYHTLHDAKVEAVVTLVDELQGEPLLVGYEFDHERERLQRRLGSDVPHLGGGVSAKRAAEVIAAWNAGRLRVLLGHPASVGHGLNLQGAAAHICWFTPTWNYEHHDQFIRRIWRQGSKAQRVIVHTIVARGTIDWSVIGALKSKARDQGALFAALKEYAKGRGR